MSDVHQTAIVETGAVPGDNVISANSAAVAGRRAVGGFAVLGGITAGRQSARIGRSAFIGAMTGVERDVIPFGLALGNRACLSGLNLIFNQPI